MVIMNKFFLNTLLNWKGSTISGTDLRHILNKSPDSRFGIIKRSVQEGLLLPIRKDFYLIGLILHKRQPHRFS